MRDYSEDKDIEPSPGKDPNRQVKKKMSFKYL